MINIEQCREKLKATESELSDKEIENIRNCLYALARVFIKDYLSSREKSYGKSS